MAHLLQQKIILIKNWVFAVEGSNSELIIIHYFSRSISHLFLNNTGFAKKTNEETNNYAETNTPDNRMISGEIINFAFLLSEVSMGSRVYEYSVERFINYSWADAWKYHSSRRWNLDNITIFIGCYRSI